MVFCSAFDSACKSALRFSVAASRFPVARISCYCRCSSSARLYSSACISSFSFPSSTFMSRRRSLWKPASAAFCFCICFCLPRGIGAAREQGRPRRLLVLARCAPPPQFCVVVLCAVRPEPVLAKHCCVGRFRLPRVHPRRRDLSTALPVLLTWRVLDAACSADQGV